VGITRTAITDDDGSGTSGTGLDNAWKQELYDQIDATLAALTIAAGDTVITLTDGATPALNAALGSVFRLAAGGDRTIGIPTNPRAGQKIVIQHYASAAIRTLALNTGAGGFRFGSDITALTATASGKTDYIGAIYNNTDSKWDVVAVTKGF
jgi:hypothetical protein